MNEFITGSIVALISFILGLFGNIWHARYQEKQKLRNESLKNHFTQLETSVIKSISEILGQITNSEGTLWIYGEASARNPKYYWPTKDFEEGNFSIFKLHFRRHGNTMTKLMNDIDNHNEKVRSFNDKLKEHIREKTGLPFRSEGLTVMVGVIEDNVPIYLSQTLYHLTVQKLLKNERATTYYDFREAKIEEEEGELWVTIKGPSAIYAKVTSMDQATSFKNVLTELMESTSLLKEMTEIYLEARRLESESRNLASLLDFTCDQHDKYGKLLKQEKDCPVCEVIFE